MPRLTARWEAQDAIGDSTIGPSGYGSCLKGFLFSGWRGKIEPSERSAPDRFFAPR